MTFLLRSILVFFLSVSLVFCQGPAAASWDDVLATAAQIGLLLLMTWLARKGLISYEVSQGILASTQRSKDKYVEEMLAARSPDSEGGSAITPSEKSRARQRAFESFMAALSSSAKSYVGARGDEWAKGLIGEKLDEKLIEAGIETNLNPPQTDDLEPPANRSLRM